MSKEDIGKRRWAIAEGYIPGQSTGQDPALASHETLCILNATARDAHIHLTIYFSDRKPADSYRCTVPAQHTCHIRF